MNMMRKIRVGLQVCALLALPAPAFAHEGHDDKSAAAAPAPAAGTPRFAAASDQFELVGVLDARTLTLYLDRFADNVPVVGARLELELGAEKLAVQVAGDHYVAQLPAPLAAGTTPVTATVVAGNATDLLAADLVVTGAATAAHAPAQGTTASAGWRVAAVWPWLATATALALLGWVVAQRRSRR